MSPEITMRGGARVAGVSKLRVITHPSCADHVPPDGDPNSHPERPQRLKAALAGADRIPGGVDHVEAEALSTDQLTQIHTPEHVREVQQATQTGSWLDSDTYVGQESWQPALRSAGAAVQAARSSIDGHPAFAITRPPGHHAERARAMGFCLFNNVALAADAMTREGHRVAIVDLDVHHGNGTQSIFADREDVVYLSIHQSPFYPGTGLAHETGSGPGEGYTVNLPVPAGTGHAGWLELVERVVVRILEAYDPGLVLVSAGFDAHEDDPIGGLELVSDTFHEAIGRLQALACPVGAVLEGGYSLQAIERCIAAAGAGLIAEANPCRETVREGVRPWGMLQSDLQSYHADRWPIRMGSRDLQLDVD